MAQDIVLKENVGLGGLLDKETDDFVTFIVDGQLFGIPVLQVSDILNIDDIAAIPMAPPQVMGSINLRGRIVTVIDVRTCLGLPTAPNRANGSSKKWVLPLSRATIYIRSWSIRLAKSSVWLLNSAKLFRKQSILAGKVLLCSSIALRINS